MMNNQHATWRLRELAYFEQNKAEEWEKHATSLVPPCGYSHRACAKAADTCRFTSAALLAGAEALEAVEVAKAALRGLVAALEEVHQDPYYQRVWNVHQLHCGPYKGKQYEAELKQATAALARLEGK
jgi:hypothetical protein